MLTRRGTRALGFAALLALAGRVLGVPELFGLAAAVAAVVLAALARVRWARGGVSVSARAIPPIVTAGEPAIIEVEISESGLSGPPSQPIHLVPRSDRGTSDGPQRVLVPRLAPGERGRVSWHIPTGRRGIVDAGAYEAGIADPLGLALRQLGVSRSARCTVLPAVEVLPSVVPLGVGWTGSESTRSAAERLVSGSSLLRRYVDGDDLRRVHWRTTARIGELMVREGGDRDAPSSVAITVVLDAGTISTPVDSRERAIEAAASVLSAAVGGAGDGTGGAFRLLATTGLDTGPERGSDGLQAALLLLAALAPVADTGVDRLAQTLDLLGRPDGDEALVVISASGIGPGAFSAISVAARNHLAAVAVSLRSVVSPGPPAGDADGPGAAGFATSSIAAPRVLLIDLPADTPLGDAWSLEPDRASDAGSSAYQTALAGPAVP